MFTEMNESVFCALAKIMLRLGATFKSLESNLCFFKEISFSKKVLFILQQK